MIESSLNSCQKVFHPMLSFLLLFESYDNYPSLQRNDTYVQVVLSNSTAPPSTVFWIQPLGIHSAVIVIHPERYTIQGWNQPITATGWTSMGVTKLRNRSAGYQETKFVLSETDPLKIGLSCKGDDNCPVVVSHLHIDPFYRQSAVIAEFAIFVSLFATVLSWTMFCGACRATRKR
jgi:hypothetical protein